MRAILFTLALALSTTALAQTGRDVHTDQGEEYKTPKRGLIPNPPPEKSMR